MSLFDGIPLDCAEPSANAVPRNLPDGTGHLLAIKRNSRGQEILLCSIHPAPAEAITEADKRGLILFTFRELI